MIQLTPSPAEEIAQRGQMLFDQVVSSKLQSRSPKDYVVINVDSGDFEAGSDSLSATRRLQERHPGATRIWGRFVGSAVSLKFGSFR